MRSILWMAAVALAISSRLAAADSFAELFPQIAANDSPETKEYVALQDKLDYRRGTVTVGDNLATLDLGEDYYYLGPEDATYVLTELWGNPPGPPSLGLVFPIDAAPLDVEGWAMLLEFDPMGYVSDADAGSYDYDALLSQMKADAAEESRQRESQGYSSLRLVGWAEPPHYDQAERKLYWAKELEFGGETTHSLNYNIRVLGRRGVLLMNVIGTMEQIDQIRAATPGLLAMTRFTEGNRYADFNPSTDVASAVGLGGLIAGGVLAKKAGLIAIALLVLKKAWFVLFIPLIWLKKRFTGRGSS